MNQYDGTTNLQPAIAALYGLSINSQAQIAKLISHAKEALGITDKRKIHNLAIYQWHCDRLNDNKQFDIEFLTAPLVALSVESIESTTTPIEQSEPIAPRVEPITDNAPAPVKQYRQLDKDGKPFRRNRISKANGDTLMYGDYEQVRIAFYLGSYGDIKRQLITLEGYYVNLLLTIGIDKKGVSTWIAQSIEQNGIDDTRQLTEQVKRLIINKRIAGND